jgi:FAD synthetase
MKLQELLEKYIRSTEVVLAEIEIDQFIQVNNEKVNLIVETAKRYFDDAKYYRDRKQFETGLASIAYSEGLLDALKLLEVAEFSWPKKTQ